ncbi:hypothetical protein BBD40_25795 [Paenibacillus ihbetae]|uniref:DUF2798 domain-containing protein n=1 Tax=Paenibacillus ihbetae TaxID=1870820 RepID=A0ABX3JU42_9BACL|nr:hypothetical protein BBD40_25795 [Paenibacillus ihbetae]
MGYFKARLKNSLTWKNIIKLIWLIAATTVFVLLTVAMFATLMDSKAIVNTSLINAMALTLGFLSIPGIFVQMFSLMFPKKKEYIATTKCPNCKHTVDIKLIEE